REVYQKRSTWARCTPVLIATRSDRRRGRDDDASQEKPVASRRLASFRPAASPSLPLLGPLNHEPDRRYDEIRLIDLDIMVTAGGEDVGGVGFEFDQVFGAFGPDPFHFRKWKTDHAGRLCKWFRLGEYDHRFPAQRRSVFNLRDACVDVDLFEVRIARKLR